jgi:hypothetical protein
VKVFTCISIGDKSKTVERQIELLQKHVPMATSSSNCFILNALAKFTNINPEFRSLVIPTFESFLESWDTELQQRAVEFIILSKNDGEDENLPNLTEIRYYTIKLGKNYSQKCLNTLLNTKTTQFFLED